MVPLRKSPKEAQKLTLAAKEMFPSMYLHMKGSGKEVV